MTCGPPQPASGIRAFTRSAAGRCLHFYALADGEHTVLFDAGLPGTLPESLVPGQPPLRLRSIIVSHADVDHFGGAAGFRQRSGEVRVVAHEADRSWIESPELLVAERYHFAQDRFGVGYSSPERDALFQASGGGVAVDSTVSNGDELLIGGRPWSVLHVPGHTPGHIALWNRQTRVLLFGDAALGFGVPDVRGALSMPPTHELIDEYLETLDGFARLEVDTALSGHWPPLDRSGFAGLVRDSRECVFRDLAFLRSALRSKSFRFAELLQALNERFRAWPESGDIHYLHALAGYLRYLERRGEISMEQNVVRGI